MPEKRAIDLVITVENVPRTRQGLSKPPPPKPAVPLPVEEESIPDDATIESTELSFDLDFMTSMGKGEGGGGSLYIPPRPIAEVIPEYPEEDLKKGIEGKVVLILKIDEHGQVVEVTVKENTTGSLRCAQSAITAVHQSRFLPARKGGKPVVDWIIKSYTFITPK